MENLKEYSIAVKNFAANGIPYLFHNKGNEHALIIFENLFINAKSEIRIAANMLYNDEVVNTKTYIDAMRYFLDRRNSRLLIIITNRPPVIAVKGHDKETSFYWMLYNHPAYKNGRVVIKEGAGYYFRGDGGQQVNFCTCDSKMYRYESDIYQRKAEANFNDEYETIKLENKFNEVYKSLQEVRLEDFFEEEIEKNERA